MDWEPVERVMVGVWGGGVWGGWWGVGAGGEGDGGVGGAAVEDEGVVDAGEAGGGTEAGGVGVGVPVAHSRPVGAGVGGEHGWDELVFDELDVAVGDVDVDGGDAGDVGVVRRVLPELPGLWRGVGLAGGVPDA